MCLGFLKRNLFSSNVRIIVERDILTYGNRSLNLRSISSDEILPLKAFSTINASYSFVTLFLLF